MQRAPPGPAWWVRGNTGNLCEARYTDRPPPAVGVSLSGTHAAVRRGILWCPREEEACNLERVWEHPRRTKYRLHQSHERGMVRERVELLELLDLAVGSQVDRCPLANGNMNDRAVLFE
eukprot:6627756-Prymnesium_polylepis.2